MMRIIGHLVGFAVRLGAVLSLAIPGAGSLGALQAQAFTQPIPVEFMAGSQYASANVVMSRSIAPESRLGFFLLNTLVMGYEGEGGDDLTMQGLLFYEPVEKFRLTGGVFYASRPGASPTLGMQYVNPGRDWFVLVAPRVNIESDPSYTVFTILRYGPGINDDLNLYTSLQSLNIFDADGHVKSYQWTRVGLESGRTQFGFAVNLDEIGPDPQIDFSVGVFVRREIF